MAHIRNLLKCVKSHFWITIRPHLKARRFHFFLYFCPVPPNVVSNDFIKKNLGVTPRISENPSLNDKIHCKEVCQVPGESNSEDEGGTRQVLTILVRTRKVMAKIILSSQQEIPLTHHLTIR